MKKVLLILITSLFLMTGCLSIRSDSIPVVWIKVNNYEEATSWCASYSRSRSYPAVRGCQYWSDKHCVIVAPKEDHVVIGHELRHCFDGNFHPEVK